MITSLMDPLHIILPLLWGAVSCSFNWTSASVSEVTVRHGDNITLYCDCKMGDEGMTVWFRNCFNENHPVLVLDRAYLYSNLGKTQFIWTKNVSSDSYDLTIINVTYSDEGFYYCATEGKKVEDKEKIDQKTWFNYSNIIRKLSIKSSELHHCEGEVPWNPDVWWKLPLYLCPAVSVFLVFSVYKLCKHTVKSQNTKKNHPSRQMQHQDAALEIYQPSVGPKRKNAAHPSTFSTYSAVQYTSHVDHLS
ncbi:uncharacterized protein LOC105357791 [Oryzias latipes]|uniref:uncharacterized protein LOC105357791 n=1 Tax=Oryzias latipes TaxID=8090 RepID=UPI000CE1B126|nr:uncharacterized protein LOC105357791 [Oryzias latipes]